MACGGKGVQQLKEQLHEIKRFVVKFYSLPQSEVLNGGFLKGMKGSWPLAILLVQFRKQVYSNTTSEDPGWRFGLDCVQQVSTACAGV